MSSTITVKRVPPVVTASLATGIYIAVYLTRLLFMYVANRIAYSSVTQIGDGLSLAVRVKIIVVSVVIPWGAVWLAVFLCAHAFNQFSRRQSLRFTIEVEDTEPSAGR